MPEFSTGPPHPHNRKDSPRIWRFLTDFLMHVRTAMNITPEQIPDEAVEAAARELARKHGFDPDETWQEFDRNAHHSYAAIGETYEDPTVVRWHLYKDSARAALAAALPVLLGEPVAWRHKPTGVVYRVSVGGKCEPLYTLPTPETPNDHP